MSRASTLVKTAAMAMMGTSLLIFPVAAQQMVLNSSDFSPCDKMSATNPAGAIQCRVDVLKAQSKQARRDMAVAENRIEVANRKIAEKEKQSGKQFSCIAFIKGLRAKGAVLDSTQMSPENGCRYAIKLGCPNCN